MPQINRPKFVEAVWLKSGRHRGGLTGQMLVVACLIFCGRNVADGLDKSVVVEPGNPFERGQSDGLRGLPGRSVINAFALQSPLIVSAKALSFKRSIDQVFRGLG